MTKDFFSERPLARELSLKVAIIIVLGLILLIPLELVGGVIQERAERARQVTEEIAGRWAAPQTLRGPFLLLPAERSNPNYSSGALQQQMIALLPENLDTKVEVLTETRSRGIFDAEIYTAKVRLSGRFERASLDATLLEGGWRLRPDLAMVAVGVSDPIGLQGDLKFAWDGKSGAAESGIPVAFLNLEGVHWPVSVFDGENDDAFEIEMTLRGSAALSLLPAGRTSSLQIAGNWPSPSFDGITLPQAQEVGDSGFKAQWRISDLSRALPQSWNAVAVPPGYWRDSVIGVKFLDPIDFYRLSERSVKYGALFIALTFLVLFLFEVLLGLAVHPIQYLMVGAALVLFFLNLVAFAEVIGFAAAYAISGLVVAGMISLYAAAVLRRFLWGSVLFATTGALYSLLFVVLRMEEAALLSGTLVLLVALGLTMFLTRRVDWYAQAASVSRSAGQPESQARQTSSTYESDRP